MRRGAATRRRLPARADRAACSAARAAARCRCTSPAHPPTHPPGLQPRTSVVPSSCWLMVTERIASAARPPALRTCSGQRRVERRGGGGELALPHEALHAASQLACRPPTEEGVSGIPQQLMQRRTIRRDCKTHHMDVPNLHPKSLLRVQPGCSSTAAGGASAGRSTQRRWPDERLVGPEPEPRGVTARPSTTRPPASGPWRPQHPPAVHAGQQQHGHPPFRPAHGAQ